MFNQSNKSHRITSYLLLNDPCITLTIPDHLLFIFGLFVLWLSSAPKPEIVPDIWNLLKKYLLNEFM